MKNIRVEIFVNGDADGVDINLTDEEADKLLALQQEAFDTILKDVEEEDYWEQFDSWLNEKTPDLYEKIMKAYYEVLCEGLCEELCSDPCDGDSFVSFSCDMDGIYIDDSNEIVINQIFPPSK